MANVEASSKPAFVVTVRPPQPGDRFRTLGKQSDKSRRGAVFVCRSASCLANAQVMPRDVRHVTVQLPTAQQA